MTDDAITVGSFDFTESIILAEVYSQALEAAGDNVEREFGIGPREFVAPALSAGLVELIPENAGAAAEFRSGGRAEPTDDVASTHREPVAALADQPVSALAPPPGQDTNASTAERLGIETLGDLAPVAATMVFGGRRSARSECFAWKAWPDRCLTPFRRPIRPLAVLREVGLKRPRGTCGAPLG